MQMRMIRIMLAALALVPVIASAQSQQINILVFPDSSCAAWSKSADNKLIRAHFESWIRGFVSGHNYANPARQVQTGKIPGGEQLYEYLDRYCVENPNSSFVGGAIRLVEQFRESTPPKPAAAAVKNDAPRAAPAAPAPAVK